MGAAILNPESSPRKLPACFARVLRKIGVATAARSCGEIGVATAARSCGENAQKAPSAAISKWPFYRPTMKQRL